jgi:ubiquinone/menaquinone biosynthesis C-methylase UbiE
LDDFVVPQVISYLRCPNCGLYQYGPPVDNSFYGDEEYHANYERHDKRKLRTAAVRLNRIAPLLRTDAPSFLDVGCGTGCMVRAAQDRGWTASGVDVSRRVVELGREAGLDTHLVGDHKLPFDDQSFDVVTAWSVIEHVTDVRTTLSEWARVLRPGGVLVVDTSDADCWKVKLLGARYRRFWRQDHTYAFTPATLGRFVEEAGFELTRRPFVGRLRDLSTGMACYAMAYQGLFELRSRLRLQKPFQIFARRLEDASGQNRRAA